jgi:hypothetical protein
MTDHPIPLDEHRGMMAQKATEMRRHHADAEADQAVLHQRQQDLHVRLAATPASDWSELEVKVRHLVEVFSDGPNGDNPRVAALVQSVLTDFAFLGSNKPPIVR